MVLGSPTQKLQTVIELAEDLYETVAEVRATVISLKGTVEDTNDRVAALEDRLDEQRRLLEALADERGAEPPGEVAEDDE